MNKLIILGLSLVMLIGMVPMAAQAGYVFTSVSQPDPNAQVETFDDANFSPNTFTSTEPGSGFSVSGGKLHDWVYHSTWTFATAITGWGGDFDLSPLGPGSGISIYFDGNFVNKILNPNDHDSYVGFWGYTSNLPFTIVELVADGQGSLGEAYDMSTMYYSSVPIPGSLLLMGSGLLSLVGIGIRRKSS